MYTIKSKSKFSWVYTIKSKSEFCAVLKKFYADTTPGCAQSKVSLNFVLCSKSYMQTLLLFAASTQYAAFIETTFVRIFLQKQ